MKHYIKLTLNNMNEFLHRSEMALQNSVCSRGLIMFAMLSHAINRRKKNQGKQAKYKAIVCVCDNDYQWKHAIGKKSDRHINCNNALSVMLFGATEVSKRRGSTEPIQSHKLTSFQSCVAIRQNSWSSQSEATPSNYNVFCFCFYEAFQYLYQVQNTSINISAQEAAKQIIHVNYK